MGKIIFINYEKVSILKIRNPWGSADWNSIMDKDVSKWKDQSLVKEFDHDPNDEGVFYVTVEELF